MEATVESGAGTRAGAGAAAAMATAAAAAAAAAAVGKGKGETMLGVMMERGGGHKKQKPPGLRRGKWTPEEEKYANR